MSSAKNGFHLAIAAALPKERNTDIIMFSKFLTFQQDLCSLINNTTFTTSKHDYMHF